MKSRRPYSNRWIDKRVCIPGETHYDQMQMVHEFLNLLQVHCHYMARSLRIL